MSEVNLGLPRVRGADSSVEFRPYTELPRRTPRRVWLVLRVVPIATYLATCVTLIGNPNRGLDLLWGLMIPFLPALFLVAPGVWRNLCPLASLNQAPRLLGFSRTGSAPRWLQERGYVLGIVLFTGLVAARRPVLNSHGRFTAAVLLVTIGAAFVGGVLVKGKGGWCSSVCPVLPVQRLYGQAPFVISPNSHCSSCVGCAKNCYDFNPTAAYQADLHEVDPDWSAPRKAFAGAMPGLVLGYFSAAPASSNLGCLAHLGVCVLASMGSIFALNAVLRVGWPQLAGLYAAVAFALFYWWTPATFLAALHRQFRLDLPGLDLPLRFTAMVAAAVWFGRTLALGARFRQRSVEGATARVSAERISRVRGSEADQREVTFRPANLTVAAAENLTLLDLAERSGIVIEAGCRMGVCGADPVRVLDGGDCLTPMTDDEHSTLGRLNLGESVRLACQARVCGSVTVSTDYRRASAGPSGPVSGIERGGPRVLIVGGGIAGVTAAETARRCCPQARIAIVGREAHPLYNRMGISRVIHGRSAMSGLFLLPETWFDDQDIECWLNTVVAALDLDAQVARLATGEALPFDRLILATGATPYVPPMSGAELPGVVTVRTAQDATEIRAYAQRCPGRDVVVAGAGLLGLEVAYSLLQLGAGVTVLERNDRLLPKFLGSTASARLADYLAALGIAVRYGVAAIAAHGPTRLEQVELSDGTRLPAQLLAMCVGVRPDLGLAAEAGLAVAGGVIVDDAMRTSHPAVFAAGDVAEYAGRSPGLWPVAVEQAKIAGENAVGGNVRYAPKPVVALLKGVGISMVSAGIVEPGPADEVLHFEGPGTHACLRLVTRKQVVVGAVSLGRPEDVPVLSEGIGLTQDQLLSRLTLPVRAARVPVLAGTSPTSPADPTRPIWLL